MNKFDFTLPEAVKETVLRRGFHIRMHKGYVATVRNLESLLWFLIDGETDDTFGKVMREDREASDLFRRTLYRILEDYKKHRYRLENAKAPKHFATFNDGFKHQFIECTQDSETISIVTKGGKRITISIMEKSDCADICYHDADLPELDNGGTKVKQFEMIGFGLGTTPVPKAQLTLATILFKK